jgi:hypothetical protein
VAVEIKAGMAPNLDLPDGYIVEWLAIDPTDGSAVSGVIVSDVSIFGRALGGGTESGQNLAGPYMLVPGPAA